MDHPVNIGFCGTGLMGSAMVRRLLAAGHSVRVWNRTLAKAQALEVDGAVMVETPAELAMQCQLVLMCLGDDQAVEDTVFGPNGVAQDAVSGLLIDHSSIAPDTTRRFAARLSAQANMQWIDAPVSGGVKGVEQGTLSIMAGGDAMAMQAVQSVTRAYAARFTHMGAVGAGQISKLCNQTIVAATVTAISEAVALAQAGGLQANKLTDALAGGWADSVLLKTFVPRMADGCTDLLGTLATMLKDINNVALCADQTDTPMPVLAAVQQSFRIASARGLADSDLSQIIQVSRPFAAPIRSST